MVAMLGEVADQTFVASHDGCMNKQDARCNQQPKTAHRLYISWYTTPEGELTVLS